MADTLVVPDASVILKWVLRSDDEDDRDRALELKAAWLAGACQIMVPTLWVFEVGNVLGLKQPRAADTLLRAVIDLHLTEEPPAAYTSGICRLMADHGVTCYDAAYHALAISRRGTMVTADARYVRRAKRAGRVCLLRDWTSPAPAGGSQP